MKKYISLILTLIIIMSSAATFATGASAKKRMNFKEVSDRIDKNIDIMEEEKKIFGFRSDYMKIILAEDFYNLCYTPDFHNSTNQKKVDEYIEFLEQFDSPYDRVNVMTQVQLALKNVSGFDPDNVSTYMGLLTGDAEEEIAKAKETMAEGKYGLVNINNITPSDITFSDIDKDDWYYETVMEMTKLGLFKGKTEAINGVSTFCPDDTITSAEFMAVLIRMIFPEIEKDDSKWYKQNFQTNERFETDEKPWYADYSHMAQKYDIGHINNPYFFVFMDAPIKREEMAQLISRAIHLSRKWSFDVDSFEKTDADILIPDYSEVNDTYKKGVKIAYLEKILMGKDDKGNFDPKGNATRAEAATVLYRFLKR